MMMTTVRAKPTLPADLREAARRRDLIAAAHERRAAKHRREAQELRMAAARLSKKHVVTPLEVSDVP
jgi:hypothetical protein